MKDKKRNKLRLVSFRKTAAPICGLFFIFVLSFWFVRNEIMDRGSGRSNENMVDLASLNILKGDIQGFENGKKEFKLKNVPVLMYHHVGFLPKNADAIRRDLTVSPNDFEEQIKELSRLGYTSISTKELSQGLKEGVVAAAKPVVITFDDGYSDVFENAVPILNKYSMIGTFAIITEFVGKPEYASWSQITEASKKGMEIVSHSSSHLDFTNPKYSIQDKLNELVGAKNHLKNNISLETETFIYPFGHFDSGATSLVAEAGYSIAFTTQFGYVNLQMNNLTLPRVRVRGSESIQRFADLLSPER